MALFQLTLQAHDHVPYIHALTEFGATVAWEAGQDTLTATFHCEEDPRLVLGDFLGAFNLSLRGTIEALEDRDWVKENRSQFPPLTIGSFFFHGSHYEGGVPPGKTPFLLDASMAFGSGEHGTTQGCIRALEKILPQRPWGSLLDMGCGSGILSMVMGRLVSAPLLAVDIDPQSVQNTKGNLHRNGITESVRVLLSQGYEGVGEEQFDLIVSNILAHPLVQMAPDLKDHLSPGGYAILSGFLEEQAPEVIGAHQNQGLTLYETTLYDGWVTAIFTS